MWMVGSDIGGTFTDLVAFETKTGELKFSKTLTTYGNLVDGVAKCLDDAEVKIAEVDVFKHGTTQVINALLERKGAPTALLTTAGFADILEIGRASRPIAFDLNYTRPPALVPRSLRFEVTERIGSNGKILEAIDYEGLELIVEQLRRNGVTAVAISFLNSFRNPTHELAVADFVRERLPETYVSAGVELSREWYEFERTSTAVANAYVGPRAGTYVRELASRLEGNGFQGKFFMMGSNGGTLSAEQSRRFPIALVESGPIGGCVGAAALTKQLGIPKVIAFDMGGTTSKCAIIDQGRFDVTPTYYVGGYERGFPVRTPVLDIVEISTGGGSIITVDSSIGIRVGPESAGSNPGPACFKLGGTEATLTDVNLFLGRIAPGAFLKGSLSLDIDAATTAISEGVAKPIGYVDGEESAAAVGALELACAQMSAVIREISVERGHDVRDFALCVFGGGGPLHGAFLARELQISRLVIPPEPGNFSALGMLFAGTRIEGARTLLTELTVEGVQLMKEAFAEMDAEILEETAREYGAQVASFERQANLRYVGQRQSLRISIKDSDGSEEIKDSFSAAYFSRYGHLTDDAAIEFVDLRVAGVLPTKTPDFGKLHEATGSGGTSEVDVRPVFHIERREWIDTPVHRRERLAIGSKILGPAVIEEFGSTTVLGVGDVAEVGLAGTLIVDIAL